jgi:osmotically-inducible protein OsmY
MTQYHHEAENTHSEERRMKIDSELRRDVERELEWDPSIDARNIAVAVKNGVVTLTGHVPTYSDMWRAENIAKRVAGVTALANEIEVKLAGARTDTDIAESAKTALRLDSRVPAENIKVIVSHGRVTLEGKVPYYYQSQPLKVTFGTWPASKESSMQSWSNPLYRPRKSKGRLRMHSNEAHCSMQIASRSRPETAR